MDTKRHQDPVYLDQVVKTLLIYKLGGQRFDLAIVSDDDALDFVPAHRDQLFPGVPVVFCGAHNFEASRLAGFRGITGGSETRRSWRP